MCVYACVSLAPPSLSSSLSSSLFFLPFSFPSSLCLCALPVSPLPPRSPRLLCVRGPSSNLLDVLFAHGLDVNVRTPTHNLQRSTNRMKGKERKGKDGGRRGGGKEGQDGFRICMCNCPRVLDDTFHSTTASTPFPKAHTCIQMHTDAHRCTRTCTRTDTHL